MNIQQARFYILGVIKTKDISWGKALEVRKACSNKDKLEISADDWAKYFALLDRHYIREINLITTNLSRHPEKSIKDHSIPSDAKGVGSKRQSYELIKRYSMHILYLKYHTKTLTRS